MSQKMRSIISKSASLQFVVCAGLMVSTGCAPQILQQRNGIPDPVYHPPKQQPQQQQFVKPQRQPQQGLPVIEVMKPAPEIVTTQPERPAAKTLVDLPPLPPIETQEITHTVRKGDSLWKVARRYGVSISELAAYNNISRKKMLRVGQTLLLPPGARHLSDSELPKIRKRSTSTKTASRSGSRSSSSRSRTTIKPLPSDGKHVVMKGDSLWKIAVQYNLKTSTLANANGLDPKNARLKIGQTLIVPGKKGSSRRTVSGNTPTRRNPVTVDVPEIPTANTITPSGVPDVVLGDDGPGGGIIIDPPVSTEPPDVILDTPVVPEVDDIPLDEIIPGSMVTTPVVTDDIPDIDPVPPVTGGFIDDSVTPPVKYTVPEDIDIDSFTVRFGITTESLKKLNRNLPPDGMLKRGTTVLLPPY